MDKHDQELLAQLAAQIAAGVIAFRPPLTEEKALHEPSVVDTSMRIAKAILAAARRPA